MITLAPEHLPSLRAITKKFKVAPDVVKRWQLMGAPIAIEQTGDAKVLRYSAEYNALQSWRVGSRGPACKRTVPAESVE